MKLDSKAYRLYAVTDRSWVGTGTLLAQVEQALLGGATMIQLREKDLNPQDFLAEAHALRALCRQFHVPFLINDSLEIALACDADGIHVGQEDLEAAQVRRALGPDKILGVSAQTLPQAKLALAQGADYLGVGAVFPTSTKNDALPVPLDTLREITREIPLPVVAIGGITEENVLQLQGTGIAGVAVISALFAQPDIRLATQRLGRLLEQVGEKGGTVDTL